MSKKKRLLFVAHDELGLAIAAARKTAGITQRSLARDLLISPQYMSDIEHGRRLPPKYLVDAIARRLHAHYLIGIWAASYLLWHSDAAEAARLCPRAPARRGDA